MFRDGRYQCELVLNNFWGVVVVRLKVKIIELVCLGMLLQCTSYERSISSDSSSKFKKPKSAANIAQSKVFEPLMLEA